MIRMSAHDGPIPRPVRLELRCDGGDLFPCPETLVIEDSRALPSADIAAHGWRACADRVRHLCRECRG